MPSETLKVEVLSEMFQSFPDAYKDAFENLLIDIFPEAGLASKIAILCAGKTERIVITFYFADAIEPDQDTTFWSIIGRLALLHFESTSQVAQSYPPVLMSLSDREREVCEGILSGKKAERIAADMDVAPSTVVTYRKRAYEKLGISSRTSLFEICGGQQS